MFDNDKANQILEEGLKEIDREAQQEDDIDKRADHIASLLNKNPKVKVEYNDDVYDLGLRITKNTFGQQVIMLMAMSQKKVKEAYLMNRQYRNPAIYSGEYNDEFSYEENIRCVVKTFLAHVTGNFKIETLEDEGNVTVVKQRRQ